SRPAVGRPSGPAARGRAGVGAGRVGGGRRAAVPRWPPASQGGWGCGPAQTRGAGASAPRVLGVAELARRRGRRYGTRRVDLEPRRPIAGLEGRPAAPRTTWLQAQPSVALVVRERADAAALAGRQAAPDARPGADPCPLRR